MAKAPLSSNPTLRNATYSDVARRWPDIRATHLETVVESSVAATAVANELALSRTRPVSIIDEIGEGIGRGTASVSGSSRGSSRGRRVGEGSTNVNIDDDNGDAVTSVSASSSSILHPPTLLTSLQPPLPLAASSSSAAAAASSQNISSLTSEFATVMGMTLDEELEASMALRANCDLPPQRFVAAAIGSDLGRSATEAAVASRRVTHLRSDMQSITREINSIERTISSQEHTRDTMTRQREVAEAVIDGRGGSARASVGVYVKPPS